MHDKFTERVRNIIYLAREEATRLQHDYIGTGHLLLGVIRGGEGIAANVLNNLGLDLDRIRQEVENMVSASSGPTTLGEIPFTPRAKRVLELAVEEARSLCDNYVGSEHLLLGLIREGEGVAATVFLELGVDRKRVREEILKFHNDTPATAVGTLTKPGGPPFQPQSKFTLGVRKVIYAARDEAARLGHDYIGAEHLLLGLIRVRECIAVTVLNNLGVDLTRIQQEVENMVGASTRTMAIDEIPITPRAKRVLEFSVEEARSLGHAIDATPHLLLGMFRMDDGVATKVLLDLGLDRKRVREETLRLVSTTQSLLESEGVDAPAAAEEGAEDAILDHPAYRHLSELLERVVKEKESLIRGREYERAARLRDREKQVRQQLNRLRRFLQSNPNFGKPALEHVARYCHELQGAVEDVVRASELKVATAALGSGRPVVLVGAPGSGRKTLADAIAHAFHVKTANTRPAPLCLVRPNFSALSAAGAAGGYMETLFRLVEEVLSGDMHMFVFPDLDQYCVAEESIPNFCEAWKSILTMHLERNHAFLGWTTPEGLERLERDWPGLIKDIQVLVLDIPEDTALLRVLRPQTERYERTRDLVFEEGFEEALLAARTRWSEDRDVADPARLLRLLDRVIVFDESRASLSSASEEAAHIAAHNTFKDKLMEALASNRFELARTLLEKLETTCAPALLPPQPSRRIVPVARIEAFLEAAS